MTAFYIRPKKRIEFSVCETCVLSCHSGDEGERRDEGAKKYIPNKYCCIKPENTLDVINPQGNVSVRLGLTIKGPQWYNILLYRAGYIFVKATND